MKPSTISSRWYFAFLAMLTALLSLCPQTLRADDCTLEKSGNYTVQIEGSNQLRFRFPVYSKSGADCWIVEGSIKIQIEGNATSENIFVVDAMEHNISGGDYNPWMRCHKEVDGTLTIGDRQVTCNTGRIQPARILVQTWEEMFSYHISRWLPLNSKNYQLYKEIEGVVEKASFLENILKANLLSMLAVPTLYIIKV